MSSYCSKWWCHRQNCLYLQPSSTLQCILAVKGNGDMYSTNMSQILSQIQQILSKKVAIAKPQILLQRDRWVGVAVWRVDCRFRWSTMCKNQHHLVTHVGCSFLMCHLICATRRSRGYIVTQWTSAYCNVTQVSGDTQGWIKCCAQ